MPHAAKGGPANQSSFNPIKLIIGAIIVIPTIIFLGVLVVVAVVMMNAKPTLVDEPDGDVAASGSDPVADGFFVETKDENLPDGMLAKRFAELDEIQDMKFSPSGDFVAVNAPQGNGIAWAMKADSIILQYPTTTAFAHRGPNTIGFEPGGVEFAEFQRFNFRATRRVYRTIDQMSVTGQYAGNDLAYITALPDVSFICDLTSNVVYPLDHETIAVDPNARWTSDLALRYYYHDGALHIFNEQAQSNEEIYRDSLPGRRLAAFAPDAAKTIISNGRDFIVYDGRTRQASEPISLRARYEILDIDISPSGNTAAIAFDVPRNEIPDGRFETSNAGALGNVQIIDLRPETPVLGKRLPIYATHVAMSHDGSQLVAARSMGEKEIKLTHWDLQLVGNIPLANQSATPVFDLANAESIETNPTDPTVQPSLASNSGRDDTNEVDGSTTATPTRGTSPRIGELISTVGPFPTEWGVESVSASSDLDVIAVMAYFTEFKQIGVWQAATNDIRIFEYDEKWQTGGMLRVSPDGKRFISGADVFDTTTFDVVASHRAASEEADADGIFLFDNIFSPDGTEVIGASARNYWRWDLQANRFTALPAFSDIESEYYFFFDVTSDLSKMYGATTKNKIVEIDLTDGSEREIPIDREAESSTTIFADAGYASSVGFQEAMSLTTLETGHSFKFELDGRMIYDNIVIDPSGRRAVTRKVPVNGLDRSAVYEVWDLSGIDPQLIGQLDVGIHERLLGAKFPMAISADGKRVLIGNEDKSFGIWSIE